MTVCMSPVLFQATDCASLRLNQLRSHRLLLCCTAAFGRAEGPETALLWRRTAQLTTLPHSE